MRKVKELWASVIAFVVAMGQGFIADDPMNRLYPIEAPQIDLKVRKRAVSIQKSLGTRSAAGFLRNRGIDLGTALNVLAGSRYLRY